MDIRKATNTKDINTLNALLQSYEAEFSAITKKQPDTQGIYPLDVDLSQTDNFLLFHAQTAIGFCVKGMSEQRHDIYEFYISPNYRGNKLGREFAKTIFARYPGDWQVRQIAEADKAIAFWRQAIGEFTQNKYIEDIVEDDYWGQVTKQTFKAP